MKLNVTAIFDIGKTNKKLLLFDVSLNVVHQEETTFQETTDDDGIACEDADKLVEWIKISLEKIILSDKFNITALNFSTYGATLVYLDDDGNQIAPLYNYLKPMPDGLLDYFYKKYGGMNEFSRATASPALGMLNSGLQIYWLKYLKTDIFTKTRYFLHLPQYISFLFTKMDVSEYTSIGCHTALWDFDKMKYHQWLFDENILLSEPVPNNITFETNIIGKTIRTGVGIHDSSASLVPYLKMAAGKKFILISTGTWVINMNPFNSESLTSIQLQKDCLCYLSVDQKQVKSSRLFLGHIHEINVQIITEKFGLASDSYKSITADNILLKNILKQNKYRFFPNGIPTDYKIDTSKLDQFLDLNSAYHQFIFELAKLEAEAINLVIAAKDETEAIYISGGFVKNEIFCTLLATLFRGISVFTADIYNSTALGAAMVINPDIRPEDIKMKIERIQPIDISM